MLPATRRGIMPTPLATHIAPTKPRQVWIIFGKEVPIFASAFAPSWGEKDDFRFRNRARTRPPPAHAAARISLRKPLSDNGLNELRQEAAKICRGWRCAAVEICLGTSSAPCKKCDIAMFVGRVTDNTRIHFGLFSLRGAKNSFEMTHVSPFLAKNRHILWIFDENQILMSFVSKSVCF